MRFTHAIVRKPCAEMIRGLTTASLGIPDYQKALLQHQKYVDILKDGGLEIIMLEPDNRYPDSTFVEDTVLLTTGCAVITRPGAPSRRGEVDSIREIVKLYFKDIHEILAPGTLDAGDVLAAGGYYFIGLSQRTNLHGASQLQKILKKYDFGSALIPLENLLHLKSGVAYLERNHLVMIPQFEDLPEFQKFRHIPVRENESYAANCIWINGKVLIAAGFPDTMRKIENAGYETVTLDMSEFRKLDGGLSCLSVRF